MTTWPLLQIWRWASTCLTILAWAVVTTPFTSLSSALLSLSTTVVHPRGSSLAVHSNNTPYWMQRRLNRTPTCSETIHLNCIHAATLPTMTMTDQHRLPFTRMQGSINDNNNDNTSDSHDDDESASLSSPNTRSNNNAERFRQQAEILREQIRRMEDQLGDARQRRMPQDEYKKNANDELTDTPSLRGKTILVVGANGRLGSMVCRYLLRTFPQTQVVAAVHVVGVNSPTARGYGRLSYEVGAEDALYNIPTAWNGEDRTTTMTFNPAVQSDFNLHNLRIVECEVLDAVQCQTTVVDAAPDAIVWCATDFDGNSPRAISTLNVAFLFRAVSRPDKGRVDIEGLQNMLGAFRLYQQDQKRKQAYGASNKINNTKNNDSRLPIQFVLVSVARTAFENFETPFGSFWGIKEQSENMIVQDFPSIDHVVVQMSRYEDNFIDEGLELQWQMMMIPDQREQDIREQRSPFDWERTPTIMTSNVASDPEPVFESLPKRRIHRRDAARAVIEALLKPELAGQTVQVWTNVQGQKVNV